MAKMIVIYKTPKDKASFERHYYQVHLPLAKQLPGLRKYEISKDDIISPTKHVDTFLIATLYFDTIDTILAAFASEIGQQCAADRRLLAPGNDDVQIYLFDTKEI